MTTELDELRSKYERLQKMMQRLVAAPETWSPATISAKMADMLADSAVQLITARAKDAGTLTPEDIKQCIVEVLMELNDR